MDGPRQTMRDFTLDFFTTFGAQIELTQGDEVTVRLPPDLAAHLNKDTLHLTFAAAEMSPYEDLVAYGSRVFEQIAAWLDRRGEMTMLRLPARFPGSRDKTALPPGLTLLNAAAQVRSTSQMRHYALFRFRLTYMADDRKEEIWTAVLDTEGTAHPEWAEVHREAVEWTRERPPLLLHDSERLSVLALQLAYQHAEARAVEVEAALRPVVEKTLGHLTTYYQAHIDRTEENEPGLAMREMLAQEQERKVAEELARHQVHVTVSPIHWATLSVPYWRYDLILKRPGGRDKDLTLYRNLNNGAVDVVHCHACERPTFSLGLCDHGHIVCADCLHTCAVCGQDVCTTCGIVQDHIGGEWICSSCAAICPQCGRPVMPSHTASCASCKRAFCHACLEVCPHCGERFCARHEVICAFCGAKRCVNQGLVCHTGQHPACEAHYAVCPACGGGICPTHSAVCTICQQTVGQDCLDGQSVCRTCREAMTSAPISWPELTQRAGWEKAYSWRVAKNRGGRVYYGERKRGPVPLWAVIVVDNSEQVRYLYRQPLGKAIAAWLGGRRPPSG